MDESVIESIKRWPNVPAVFGWLSLTPRGQWRLHPAGKALQGEPGESIGNSQILGFINRNYSHDEQGRWFFQNGPQRVYVRLDAAPWTLFADDSQGLLSTHTGLPVQTVRQMWVSREGNLYLQTDLGPGILFDRDLPRFLQGFTTLTGQALEDWWADANGEDATHLKMTSTAWQACPQTLPVRRLRNDQSVGIQLGFVANPKP